MTVRALASLNTISIPNPHHRQNVAVLLSRTYVFAAFGGGWPGVTFLFLALSGKLAFGPIAPLPTACTATKAEVKRESEESSRRTDNVLANIFPRVKSPKYF